MNNETEQSINQSARAEAEAVNQGAQADNQSARAEEVRDSAAMTEEPQAGAVAPAGTEQPEGEKAGRVNIPAAGTHKPGTYRARREAHRPEVQARQAERDSERRRRMFPKIDAEGRAMLNDYFKMMKQLGEKNVSELIEKATFICPEWQERIDEIIGANKKLQNADKAFARCALIYYSIVKPFADLEERKNKPARRGRGAGKKKAPAAGLPVPYYVYPYQKEMADIPQLISKGRKPKLTTLTGERNGETVDLDVKAWEAPGIKLAVERDIDVNLSVGVDQLFKWCCVLLGQKNHTDGTGAAADKEKRTVKVTVDKWNQLKGGDLTIHPDRPRDEELQRLKTMRANGRRELERYARFLSHSIIYRITRTGGREIVSNWKEAGRNWGFLNLFASGDLIDDTLTMVFDSDTADEILSSPTMRRISAALFRLNGNNINAYRIECAALNLFTMDANHGKAQANTLTAGQMLEYTDITKPDENRRKGQDWQKSKRTLENSLNAAVSAGVITGWRYCGTNGAELTPEERKQLETDSSAWESANIWQDFPAFPDQSERIERKEKKRAERRKRKEKSELEKMKKDVSGLKKTVYHRKKRQQGGNQ